MLGIDEKKEPRAEMPGASGARLSAPAAENRLGRRECLIIYDAATGRIYYDADGSGAGAQVLFAQVTAGLALTNADFSIIA